MPQEVASVENTEVIADEKPAESEAKAPETEAKEDTKPEKKDGFQKAIDRQTRKYYQEKARADALENQIRQQNPGASAPANNINADPDRSKFDSDEDFNRALIRHEAKKIAAETLANERQAEAGKAIKSKWDKDAAAVRKENPDFDESFEDFISSGIVTPAMDKAILESDRPAAVSAYLAANTEEAEKIAGLSDFRAAIEIGKIEVKLATQAPTKKASAAPAPIVPIGGKGGAGEVDPEKETPKEFAARRNKERSLKGKR